MRLDVELLRLLVEWGALLDRDEALDVQSLACLLDCCEPSTERVLLLGPEARLLAHNLAHLGLSDLACKGVAPGELCGDNLLLHGLHGFHGGHGLHCFHCLGHLKGREELQGTQYLSRLS